MQVVPFTLKERMLFDVQNYIEISRRPAMYTTFAESGDPAGLLKKYGLTAADIVREALALAGK